VSRLGPDHLTRCAVRRGSGTWPLFRRKLVEGHRAGSSGGGWCIWAWHPAREFRRRARQQRAQKARGACARTKGLTQGLVFRRRTVFFFWWGACRGSPGRGPANQRNRRPPMTRVTSMPRWAHRMRLRPARVTERAGGVFRRPLWPRRALEPDIRETFGGRDCRGLPGDRGTPGPRLFLLPTATCRPSKTARGFQGAETKARHKAKDGMCPSGIVSAAKARVL